MTLYSEKSEHFSIIDPVELLRSMTAILEMPQYVAYQKNFAYAFIKLSAKSHNLTFCAQWMCLAALLDSFHFFFQQDFAALIVAPAVHQI